MRRGHLHGRPRGRTIRSVPLWVIAILVIVVVVAAALYNGLVQGRNRVRQTWADIDALLARRAATIPALVAAVEGSMAHEKAVLGDVVRTRAEAVAVANRTPAFRSAAEASLGGALSRLLIVVEGYPQLKSARNVAHLIDGLRSIENSLATGRLVYNRTVEKYNTAQRQFPGILVASLTGAKPAEFFEAEAST